jgi:hypothetical protein
VSRWAELTFGVNDRPRQLAEAAAQYPRELHFLTAAHLVRRASVPAWRHDSTGAIAGQLNASCRRIRGC